MILVLMRFSDFFFNILSRFEDEDMFSFHIEILS